MIILPLNLFFNLSHYDYLELNISIYFIDENLAEIFLLDFFFQTVCLQVMLQQHINKTHNRKDFSQKKNSI
jgi:hypothetical protein